MRINKILLRDYQTGNLTLSPNSQVEDDTTLIYESNQCVCTNILESAEINFIINPDTFLLDDIVVDLILIKKIKQNCESSLIIEQTYSTRFLNSFDDNYVRSGSPGYIQGKRLLTAYNGTIQDLPHLISPKEGTYLMGRRGDGSCSLNLNDEMKIESFADSPIPYGVNLVYSCVNKFDLELFKTFCVMRQYEEYGLYRFVKKIEYVGMFGNANIEYLSVSLWFILCYFVIMLRFYF